MLEEPKKTGAKVLSHMLSSHGGEQVFLLYIKSGYAWSMSLLLWGFYQTLSQSHLLTVNVAKHVFKWNMEQNIQEWTR